MALVAVSDWLFSWKGIVRFFVMLSGNSVIAFISVQTLRYKCYGNGSQLCYKVDTNSFLAAKDLRILVSHFFYFSIFIGGLLRDVFAFKYKHGINCSSTWWPALYKYKNRWACDKKSNAKSSWSEWHPMNAPLWHIFYAFRFYGPIKTVPRSKSPHFLSIPYKIRCSS